MTHEEKRERLRQIGREFLAGATIESLVEKYGLGYAYIYEHLKGMYPDNPRFVRVGSSKPKPTKLKRWQRAIKLFEEGRGVDEIALEMNRNPVRILELLRTHFPDNPRLYKRRSGELSNSKDNMLLILAQLINTDRALEAIGNDFGVTRQYVCRILVAARDAGIGVHPARERRRRGAC